MSRSYRVWNDIRADKYISSKSFGGEFKQYIAVGSSASYSNDFASIEVREVPVVGTDWSTFVLYVDGAQIKRAIFNNKTKEFHGVGLDKLVLTVIDELEEKTVLSLASENQELCAAIKAAFFEHGSELDEYGIFEEDRITEICSQSYDGFIPFTNGGIDAMIMQDLGLAHSSGQMGNRESEIIQPYIDSALNDAAYDFIQCRDELEHLRENLSYENGSDVLFEYFNAAESEHDTKAAHYPVDMSGDKLSPFWNSVIGLIQEEFYEFESEYMSEGGEYWLQFRAIFYAADNRRNVTGKDEIYFFAGVNTDFTYGRDKGIQSTFDRTYPIERLTAGRVQVIAQAMRDSL